MKLSKERPYVLFVAEIIYSEIIKIKKNNPGFSNVDALDNFIGSETYKILEYDLKCVSCNICDTAKRMGTPVKLHKCYKNFDGHAKAMEATSTATLVTRIFEKFDGLAKVSTIVVDDDSSMRSHCSHEGGLPHHVTQPIFLADPSHRCKVIGKPLFKLASMKKSDCTLSSVDANRLKIYTACFFNMVRKQKRDISYVLDHVWCILHHYFDDHQFCTSDFCYKKRGTATDSESTVDHRLNTSSTSKSSTRYLDVSTTPQQKENIHDNITNTVTQSQESTMSSCDNVSSMSQLHSLRSKPGYYRCMQKDNKLFKQLKHVLEPHFSKESLTEVMHCHNTQLNEGLNTSVSMMAPKYKNYSRSSELATRVAMTVGCHNLGKYAFLKRVIDRLDFVNEPKAFLDSLGFEDRKKSKKRDRQASVASKQKRIRKRVKKSIDGRMKHIDAVKRGTTYGDNHVLTTRRSKSREASTCAYHKFGCGNEREPHKTLQSIHCKYHYLYKIHASKGNTESITQKEWMEKVKHTWANENKESITNSRITTMDVVNEEYDGDSSILDAQQLSSNSSDYSEPDFDPSMSYTMICEKKNKFSNYASQHSDDSFQDSDMLSDSDEDDDDYNQRTEGNNAVVSNEMLISEEDLKHVYNMTDVDNTEEQMSKMQAADDEKYATV